MSLLIENTEEDDEQGVKTFGVGSGVGVFGTGVFDDELENGEGGSTDSSHPSLRQM